jgi:predicted Zn-dependent peptidase
MYRKSTLENGIRVVTKSMANVRSIAMGVLVDSGIMDESREKNGLAHLTEHLMFGGTSNRDSRQIARFMDEAGGQMGGFITRDYTCYTATVLDDYRTFAVELLGDILLNSIYSESNIEREKNTITREIESGLDLPDQRCDALLKSHIWRGHYLGKSINGSPQSVMDLTREDVIYFVHSHYMPDRLIIAAAGNIDHNDYTSQVQDAFWRMMGQSTPRQRARPPFYPGVAIKHIPVSQAYFSIGLRSLPYAHPQRYAVHVLNKILGGGISSRLFRRIREERGLVYDIRTEYQAYHDDGLLVVEGSTSPELLMQVLFLTLSEIWKTINEEDPIDDDELWKAKMQIRGQHLISAECSNTQMSRLATQELYFGNHISSDRIIGAIDQVELNTLASLTQNTFLDAFGKTAVAVIGPEAPEKYSASMIEELLGSIKNN